MALDNNLIQHIELTAEGDALLKPLEAFRQEIQRVVSSLENMSGVMVSGGENSEASLRQQVKLLQQLIGEASTLHKIMQTQNNAPREGLLRGLDQASMGRRLASATELRKALTETSSASQALEVRLHQMRLGFNEAVAAGKQLRDTDISRAMNIEKAITDTKRLERELAMLDVRAERRGGMQSPQGTTMRAQIADEYRRMLELAQNPNAWAKNMGQIQLVIDKVNELARAEAAVAREAEKASISTRLNSERLVGRTEAQLRAAVQQGAASLKFTPDQARGFDMPTLGAQIEQNMQRLRALQVMMGRALSPDMANGEAKLNRLQRYWDQIVAKTSEAIAQQRAYNQVTAQDDRSARAAQAVAKPGQVIRDTALATANQNEAQIRALAKRGSNSYQYTPTQAQGFDLTTLRTQVDQNIQRLQSLQTLMCQHRDKNGPGTGLKRGQLG